MVVPFETIEQASTLVSFLICVINASNHQVEVSQLSAQPVTMEANIGPDVQPLLLQLCFLISGHKLCLGFL